MIERIDEYELKSRLAPEVMVKVLGTAGSDAVFVCDEVLLVRGSPSK